MPKLGVEYVVAMASNAVLNRKAEEAMQVARLLAGLTDRTEHVYDEVRYAAGSWKQERRVIIKAEVVRADHKEPKDNPRFVITNMKQTPQWLYEEVYCQRGEIENRIKELHAHADRPHQLHPLLGQPVPRAADCRSLCVDAGTAPAAAHTDCARAQVWTMRERFLKLGARVILSVRRIVVHLPQSFPFLPPSGTWPWNWEHRPDSIASPDQQTSRSTLTKNAYREKLCPKIATASTARSPTLPAPAIQPTSSRQRASSSQSRAPINLSLCLHE